MSDGKRWYDMALELIAVVSIGGVVGYVLSVLICP